MTGAIKRARAYREQQVLEPTGRLHTVGKKDSQGITHWLPAIDGEVEEWSCPTCPARFSLIDGEWVRDAE